MYTNVTTMKRSSNDLNKKLIGRSSKNDSIPMKHINIFLRHLLQLMIIFSKKLKRNKNQVFTDNEKNH